MLRSKPIKDDSLLSRSGQQQKQRGGTTAQRKRKGSILKFNGLRKVKEEKEYEEERDAITMKDYSGSSYPQRQRQQEGVGNSQPRVFMKKAGSGVIAAKKGTVRAGQLVGKGGRVVGKGGKVVGKGTVKFGAATGKGALTATRLVAKNTVKVGKGVGENAMNVAEFTVAKGVNLVTDLAARTLKRNEVAAAAAWKTRTTARTTKIELEISCRNLRRKDAFSECDAFAVLWEVPIGYGSEASIGHMGGDESRSSLVGGMSLSSFKSDRKQRKHTRVPRQPTAMEKEIGRTEVLKGNKNPEFIHKFVIDFRFQEEQTYVIRIYDRDLEFCNDLKEHDFLGATIFTLGELMGSGKRTLKRPLRARAKDKIKSTLTIKGSEVSTTRSVMEFRFSAEDLTEKDKTAQVLERQDDLFFHIMRLNMEDQTWQPIHKSEVVMHSSSPTWAKTRMPLPDICNDNITNPIKITFWDWKREDQSEELGYVETTCQVLVAEAQHGIPVFDVWRDRKRGAFGRTVTTKQGKLKVLRAELKPVPTLLDYVAGGCKLDVTIAVDCSVHNGDPQLGGFSLHHHEATWLNDYQAAISRIGNVMEPYSKKGKFNIWGFGATLRGEEAPHFPMTGHGDASVKGVNGLLEAYDTTFVENPNCMEQAENSDISPLIQSAMYNAIQKSEIEQCYSVLCILTTGKIGENLQEIIDTLCTAAEDAPLSIVIIGIGNNQDEFDDIKELLANGGKLRHSNGVPIARDIITFASFCDFNDSSEKVVAEALRDVPEQLVEYYTDSGIMPLPTLPKDEEMSFSMQDSSSKSHNSHSNWTARSANRGRRARD